MIFRASAKGEWLRSRTLLYTSRAREGPGEGCPSKGVVSGTSSCKVSFKEASLFVGYPPDPADIFFSWSSLSTSLLSAPPPSPTPHTNPNLPLEYSLAAFSSLGAGSQPFLYLQVTQHFLCSCNLITVLMCLCVPVSLISTEGSCMD